MITTEVKYFAKVSPGDARENIILLLAQGQGLVEYIAENAGLTVANAWKPFP